MAKKKINSSVIVHEIEKSKDKLESLGVKKIGVFGSFAKNKQHKKSDIDILVTFNKETFDSYMDVLFLLEKIFKRKVDLVIEKDLHPELKYVKKETKYVRI